MGGTTCCACPCVLRAAPASPSGLPGQHDVHTCPLSLASFPSWVLSVCKLLTAAHAESRRRILSVEYSLRQLRTLGMALTSEESWTCSVTCGVTAPPPAEWLDLGASGLGFLE